MERALAEKGIETPSGDSGDEAVAPLSEHTWTRLAAEHAARAQRFVEPHRIRRARSERHPVLDFLFDYYRYSSQKLTEWHPPHGVAMEDSTAARERFGARWYRATGGVLRRISVSKMPKVERRLAWTKDLLLGTQERTPWLGCFGVHEWAMVYGGQRVRHAAVAQLRLPQADVDAFVESQPIRCTHFDAFRFFADEAKPLNRLQPSLDGRASLEQPGCIHANMDLYKWAYKSMPWIGSELLWDTFELAVELRELDMRASPYDLRSWGYDPIPVETRAGQSVFRTRQEEYADRARELRGRLIASLTQVLAV